jgi:hypothetical protein
VGAAVVACGEVESTAAVGWGTEASVGAEAGGSASTPGAEGVGAQEAVNKTATSPTVKKRKRGFIKSPYWIKKVDIVLFIVTTLFLSILQFL